MSDQIVPQMRSGDLNPPLVMQIGDSRADADFSSLTKNDVQFVIVKPDGTTAEVVADSIAIATDHKSATVKRNWVDGETDQIGHYWVRVYAIPWGQTFPDDGPLRLDVGR